MKCIFCDIIQNKIPCYKVYENERVLAFLDINPSAPGHTLIIPKKHEERLENLSLEDSRALFDVLHLLVPIIQKALDAQATSIGINNGPEAGQEIPHVHIHVIPRNSKDGGGIIQRIARSPSNRSLNKVSNLIKENLI